MAKQAYENYSTDHLIAKISELKKKKKFGIIWEDKKEEVVEYCKLKLPVLEEEKAFQIMTEEKEPVNLLIEGDNYHCLSVLNYTHGNKIDVIYIDPPYNTGARDWTYNNNFVDGEDPYRHTKWLSFMNHRLRLAKNLLKDTGIICVTIDDNEMPRLWLLMEEILGERNHLGTVAIRINPGGRKSKRKIAAQHEYALFFSKTSTAKVALIYKPPEEKTHTYKKDKDGWYEERNLRKEGADSLADKSSKRYYAIYYDPKTGKLSSKTKLPIKILPIDSNGQKRIWRRDKNEIGELAKSGVIFSKNTVYGNQVYFKFRGGLKGEAPKSFWSDPKFSASEHGTQTLHEILGERETFEFPKSPHATAECIKVASDNKEAIILDFFAGSGTTAQAVLQLNKTDGGNRKFILCTNDENNIAKNVCYPRISRVMKGYGKGDGRVSGLGGNLKYFKTTFVEALPTDNNKKKLVDKSTEMLCITEDCFQQLATGKFYKIFKNKSSEKYLGIVYDDLGIEAFREVVKSNKKRIITYVFSLDTSAREEEFEDVADLVILKPIPEVILNVYRRIFR